MKTSPMKNMAYWKNKSVLTKPNPNSPIKQGPSLLVQGGGSGSEKEKKNIPKEILKYGVLSTLNPGLAIQQFKKDYPKKVEEIKTKGQKFVEKGKKYIKKESKDITLKNIALRAMTSMFTRMPIVITKKKK